MQNTNCVENAIQKLPQEQTQQTSIPGHDKYGAFIMFFYIIVILGMCLNISKLEKD